MLGNKSFLRELSRCIALSGACRERDREPLVHVLRRHETSECSRAVPRLALAPGAEECYDAGRAYHARPARLETTGDAAKSPARCLRRLLAVLKKHQQTPCSSAPRTAEFSRLVCGRSRHPALHLQPRHCTHGTLPSSLSPRNVCHPRPFTQTVR